MIPVDAPFTPWVLGALLVGLIGLLAWRGGPRDRQEYARFKRYRSTRSRQMMMRRWLFESFGWFGGASLVVLACVWAYIPRMLAQVETWPAMRWLRDLDANSGMVRGLVVGVAIGLVIAVVVFIFVGREAKQVHAIGDIHALLPRNRAELKYGLALSINAGLVEELLFRLAMPTLIFTLSSNAIIAVASSLLAFGLMHAYQGISGVIGSFILGVIFMALFLITGNIIWPIIVHALFDIRSLVFIPMLVYGVHKQTDATSR